MKVKALKSFCGAYNMTIGQIAEVEKDSVICSLLENGFIEEVKEPKKSKAKTKEK